MSRKWSVPRRALLFGSVGALAAALTVGLAAGASATTHKAIAVQKAVKAAPPATNSTYPWLPAGVTPAGADWPTTGGDLAGSDYSTLNQINTKNVSKLHVAFQLASLNIPAPGTGYKPENQPIVLTMGSPDASGKPITNLPMKTTMFMQTNYGLVALNPTNGDILWQYKGALTKGNGLLEIGARSISYGDGYIFGGQQDGSLVALDAKTGAPVWTVDTDAAGTTGVGNTHGESNPWSIFDGATTTNKLAQDLVFSAPNGGDSPLRGHFDAFNAKTGVLVWRTWNTPDPTQIPFILSWGNPAEAVVGGGASWSLPAIDNNLQKIYYGTGNHFPESGASPGKALWTDTLMAVNLSTGALKWYFQTVHHDEWDFDTSNAPVRINVLINGKRVPVVAIGCKNGYMYILNANNGGAVPNFGIPEVKIPDPSGGAATTQFTEWPTQPEPVGGAGSIVPHCVTSAFAAATIPGFPTAPNGTPMVPTCSYAAPVPNEYEVWGPTAAGGIQWTRESYDPATNDLYVCGNYGITAKESTSTTAQTSTSIGGGLPGGSVSALNMSTNKLDWQFQIPVGNSAPGGPTVRNGTCYSGDTSTAGGITFAAQNSAILGDATPAALPAEFDAFDSKTGKILWSWMNNEGSVIRGSSETYTVGGKEYVIIEADAPTSGTTPTDHLTVFSL